MKVFWRQAGPHFEPEPEAERSALALVLDSAKLSSVFAPSSDSTGRSSILPEQGAKIVAADSEGSPCASGLVVEKLAHE